MMNFVKSDSIIIATYVSDNDTKWLLEKLNDDISHTFNKTFTFSKKDV